MFDGHIHTKFSTDSKMTIEAAIKRANELNLGIITTEHIDFNCPVPGEFIFDVDKYFKEYSKYRNNKVLLGVEIGMIDDRTVENEKVASSYPFDYVIGSIHIIDNIDIYYNDFYDGRNKKESYEHYFKYMLHCIKSHSFVDSLGHIDYIARYANYDDKELYYDDFSDHIDEILKTVVENGIALELNTRRLNNKEAVKNLQKIYKRYYQLGGKIITVGSDAHSVDSIGCNFNKAKVIAESCNVKIVYFKERNPEYI
jgi:histidinol-phosphatase (PHP family)